MRALPALLFCLAAITPPAALHAKDHGVQGRVWEIIEIDMRQLFAEDAARTDWQEVSRQREERLKRYLEDLPGRSLPVPERNEVIWMDPTFELDQDIQAPLPDEAGALRWQVLFPKGTRVNPLQHVRPTRALLYFDGSSEEQVEFVRSVLTRDPLSIVPVETRGKGLTKLTEDFGRPVFFASDQELHRFGIERVPTLLFPGSGDRAAYLGLLQLAPPFKPELVQAYWPGPIPPQTPPTREPADVATPSSR